MVRAVPRSLLLLALLLGSGAITVGSLVYFDGDEVAPFVIEKLPLPYEALWLFALRVHVVAAMVALPGCVFLVSNLLLKRAPRLHRRLGRVTGAVALLALAPSGFYLSLFAKGGIWSTVGFMVSGGIVVGAMVRAITTARARSFTAHRRWAWHVLAQMSVAVSSRAMLFGFDAFGVDADAAYLLSLWLPVVASAAFVELLVARRTVHSGSPRHDPTSRVRLADPRHAGLRSVA